MEMSTLTREASFVQNPALGAVLLWRFCAAYAEFHPSKESPVMQLSFLVLPILLHRETFEEIKSTRAGFHTFVDKFSRSENSKADVLLSIHDRVSQFRDLTHESIRLAVQCRLVTVVASTSQIVSLSSATPSGVKPSVQTLIKNAEKLGEWCAPMTLFEIENILKVPIVDRPETVISYDIMGREVRRKVKNNDAANNVQWIETVTGYDALGRPSSVSGPHIIGSTDPVPVSFTFRDQLGNTRFEVDPRGAITEYRYDGLGRLKKTIAPPDRSGEKASSERFYNVAGDIISEEVNGRETVYSVDARGRTFQVKEPTVTGTSPAMAPTTTVVYDALGAVTSEQRPHGNTTTIEYDNLHRVASVSRPSAGSVHGVATTTQLRDPFGNLKKTTNEFGATSTFERNNIDQVTESTLDVPASSDVSPPRIIHASEAARSPEFIAQDASEFPLYASTAGGTVIWTITELKANVNYKVSITWDAQSANTTAARYLLMGANDASIGQELVVDQTKAPNEVFADGFSWRTLHVLSTADGTAKIRLTSGAPGRLSAGHLRLTEMTAAGGTTENRYYPTGLLNWTRDSQGNKTSYTYDALGRTSFIEDASGNRTYFGYDLLGRQTSIKDPNGNITVFKYDGRGNKTEERRFLSGQSIPTQTRRFKYDLNDNLELAQDALGRVRTYAYDNLNRQWQEAWFANPTVAEAGSNPLKTITYEFDLFGRLKSASDDGSLFQYNYDELDRLTSESIAYAGGLSPVITLETKYPTRQDAQRQALWTLLNGVLDNTIEFQYDEQLRLKSLKQFGAGQTAAVRDKFVTFKYDADGRFESINRYQDQSDSNPLSLVFSTSYDYDGRGQLTALTHFKSTLSNLAKYVYSYDSEGRIIGISSNDGAALYSYASNGRLSEENYNFGSTVALGTIRHDYDAAGNAKFKDAQGETLDTASQPGDFNRIESDGTYTYEYDAEGNRTAKVRIFDGARTEYDWDHRNRLVRVRELGVGSGSGSASGSLGGSAFISGSGSAAAPQLNLYSSGSGGGVYSFVSTQGEGNQGSINFWATQTLQEPIDVEYWSEDGTAANYEDYILPPPSAPGRVTLQPWSPFAYVSFALPDDYEATGTQNFHVKWRVLQSSGSGGGGGGSASGGGWSSGSAALPGSFYGPASNSGSSLSWEQKFRNASASAGGVTVSTSTAGEDSQLVVYLWKQDYGTPSTIEYWVEDGSAQVNADFVPVHNTVTLDSANYGWSWNYYGLVDDLTDESEESYILKFRVDGGPVQTLVNTIVDNDQTSVNVTMNSTVWISTSAQEEGQPIYLYAGYWSWDYYGGYPFPVTVQFTVTDALGQPSGDVTTPSFTVTFAPYQTDRYITLPTIDDSLVEGVETLHFHAQLVAPHSGAVDFDLQLADNDFGLPLTSGLLGQWEFNNDTLDSSGFGRHLTSSDATYRVGVTGTGLQGTAEAPSPAALAGAMTAGDYTTSFWFEVPKSGVSGDLLARHSISGNGWANFSARYGGSGQAYLGFSNSHGTTSSSASGVTSGWHHAAFVRAGGVLTMYLDGVAVGTANGASGSSGFAPQFAYQGVTGIDAAQVWTRALSPSDIAQVFLSPPQPQAVYSLTAAVADDEQPELAYTPTSFYAIVDPTYEGGSLHILAGINVYTGSPVSLEIELVGAPEVLIRLQQPTATIVIPAWSTWGDVYLPTLDDNQYQGTLPVEVRVRLAAPSVSEVYTGSVNLGDDELPPSTATKVVEYTYDYRNRLIGREEDGEREAFVYDGEQVLLRFDDVGDLASRYLWGPGVDLLLTDEQLDTGDLLWAAGDHQNSVRDLVTFDPTTHTAQVAAHRVYTTYGSLASETRQAGDATAAAVDTIFGYTGRYFDDATRLQNNLNRWYDPETKQWASEDPIGFAAGDPNPRRYVGNDPVNRVDPDGLEELPTESLSQQQRQERLKVIINQREDAEFAQAFGTSQIARHLWPLSSDNPAVDALSAYFAEPLIVSGLGSGRFLWRVFSAESEGRRAEMVISHAAGYLGESRLAEQGEALVREQFDYKYMTVMPRISRDQARRMEALSNQTFPDAVVERGAAPVWLVDRAEQHWQTQGDYESGAYGVQAAPLYDFVIEEAGEAAAGGMAKLGAMGAAPLSVKSLRFRDKIDELVGMQKASQKHLLDLPEGIRAANAPNTSVGKYSIGPYNELKGQVSGLDAHHVGQQAAMKKLVPGYDPATAPTILVPKVGHTIRGPNGIVSRSVDGLDTARSVIARDIKELRRVYPDIPNSRLQELIDMNKQLYPSMNKATP